MTRQRAPVHHPTKAVRVRWATLRDLELLVAHRKAMWTSYLRRSRVTWEKADSVYRSWLRPRMRRGEVLAAIAEDAKGTAVGSLTLRLQEVEPGPETFLPRNPLLATFYVKPRSRRQGIGTALVHEVVRWARREGYEDITGRPLPKAEALLRSQGFEKLSPEFGLILRGRHY
jgi:GNAT superfamily N-acetyltransferase